MYELVTEQIKEVEKAVIGMGEYKFKLAYTHLEVPSNKWFLMTSEQRQRHLKKVIDMSSVSLEDASTSSSSVVPGTTRSLSIPPENCGITTVSAELLEATWKKAGKLLDNPGNICPAPGMSGAMCVASESGEKPHIVSKTKKGSLACDDSCLAWKSNKLCSHVLAVAEEWGCLNDFISWYRRLKTLGNYTAVCMYNQSKDVGRKPGDCRRKGSQNKKPDIEAYVDPLANASIPTNHSLQQHSSASFSSLLNVAQEQEVASQAHEMSASQQHATSQSASAQQRSSQPLSSHTIQPNTVATPACHQAVTIQSSHNTIINNAVVAALAQLLQPNQTGSTNQISHCLLNTPLLQTHQPMSPPVVTSSYPFDVKFLTPAIKICAGCRSGYTRAPDGKNCPAPHDLCLVHKEQHLYYNTVNARQQLSSLSNVHYHVNVKCPRIRFMNFDPCAVRIPDDVRNKLVAVHKKFLLETFGIC